MKTRFQASRGTGRALPTSTARASRMRYTARRLIAGVVVVAGAVAGCGGPGTDAEPDNSRLAQGSEAVLYEPNVPTVDFLVPDVIGKLGEMSSTLVRIPVGTRVRVEDDSLTDLVSDRTVRITILEGEHKGHSEFFRRKQLRPATEPWTRRPEPAPDALAPDSKSEEPAPDPSTPPATPDKSALDTPTAPRADRPDGPPSPGSAPAIAPDGP